MAVALARRCIFALVSIFTLSSAAVAQSPYSDLYVFGDSLTDSGNAFIATDNLPLFPQVPGPAYFQGRFSNGYNFADDLSLRLFGHVTEPALSGGHNFAVGGATTGTQNRAAPVPSGMRVQTDTFVRALGNNSADPNALYLVYGGSNDIFDATSDLSAQNPGDINGLVTGAMSNLAEIIGDLSAHGARHFLIPNVADLGKVPSLLSTGAPSSFATQASAAFNQALDTLLNGYTNLDIHRLDVHAAFDEVRAGKFGFADVTTPCYSGGIDGVIPPEPCQNPDDHVFWDKLHPSARTHLILGDLAFAAAVPEPQTWLVLLVALSFCAIMRERRV